MKIAESGHACREPRGKQVWRNFAAVTSLELYDHQSALPLDMERLFRAASDALPLVLLSPGSHPAVLDELDEVEVSLIDDATIAGVHAEFMNDPSATDVITFDHGEILISTETAIRQATQGAHSPQRECALYMIHGLLHLNGHDDHSAGEFASMKEIQESILRQVWPHGG
jgi:probable rRNA maturation factor